MAAIGATALRYLAAADGGGWPDAGCAARCDIWKDISRHATNQTAPSGFNATVGEAIPSNVSTYPLPRQASRDVPAVKPYRYAMMQDKVLIVNPNDKKIADVVSK